MSAAKRKLRLVKLKKYNTIWHPDSTLVFKSQKERFVIGRLVDKELVPLDDEAIELAEQWKLKIDESLLESESEEKDSEGSDTGSNDENTQEEDSQGEENTQEEEESHEEQSQEDGDSHEAQEEENLVEVAKEDNLQLKESEKTPKALTVDTSFKDNELTNEIMQNARKTVDLIIGLETKLEIVSKEKTELQTSYDDLKEKYDAIMNKFNTMKSLFA